ncbi:hypothetical protein QV65_13370 [Rhodococcus erythropolis]|nr:hypothetical protein QV65_13370 [Rhodococcus erythropolis]
MKSGSTKRFVSRVAKSLDAAFNTPTSSVERGSKKKSLSASTDPQENPVQTFTDTIAVLLFLSPLWFPLLLAIIFNKQLKQYATTVRSSASSARWRWGNSTLKSSVKLVDVDTLMIKRLPSVAWSVLGIAIALSIVVPIIQAAAPLIIAVVIVITVSVIAWRVAKFYMRL